MVWRSAGVGAKDVHESGQCWDLLLGPLVFGRMNIPKDIAEQLARSPPKGSCLPQRMIVGHVEVYNITV